MRAQGMTIRDIAVKLGCSPQVVRDALRKAADVRTPSGSQHGDWLAPLPYRAANILMREGYKDVQEVRHAIDAGVLSPGVTHSLGPNAWKAICDWLGIDPPTRTRSPGAKPKPANLEHARRMLERAGYRVIAPKNGLKR
jgi:hypothetical protein